MSYPAGDSSVSNNSDGNVFTNKVGPLPLWGWMAVGLLLAVLFYMWHKNSSSSNVANTTASPSTVNTPGGVDSSLVPQFVNQVYNEQAPPNITLNNSSSSSSQASSGSSAASSVSGPATSTTGVAGTSTAGGTGSSSTPPASSTSSSSSSSSSTPAAPPKTTPAGQQYITVTVGKFPTGAGGSPGASENSFGPGTAAWNSTLWGIATHYNVPGGYQALAKLNGIANPNVIYAGQKIKVPVS